MSGNVRIPAVQATTPARTAVRRLVEQHGPLLFVLSAGCCDGSAPMCFPAADFAVGDGDLEVGRVEGCPVYVDRRQLEAWPHRDLLLDVQPGYADGMSLEPGPDQHFVDAGAVCGA